MRKLKCEDWSTHGQLEPFGAPFLIAAMCHLQLSMMLSTTFSAVLILNASAVGRLFTPDTQVLAAFTNLAPVLFLAVVSKTLCTPGACFYRDADIWNDGQWQHLPCAITLELLLPTVRNVHISKGSQYCTIFQCPVSLAACC